MRSPQTADRLQDLSDPWSAWGTHSFFVYNIISLFLAGKKGFGLFQRENKNNRTMEVDQ